MSGKLLQSHQKAVDPWCLGATEHAAQDIDKSSLAFVADRLRQILEARFDRVARQFTGHNGNGFAPNVLFCRSALAWRRKDRTAFGLYRSLIGGLPSSARTSLMICRTRSR